MFFSFQKSILSFFLLLFIFQTKAQNWCGLPPPTENEKRKLLQAFINTNNDQKARINSNYTIFLRPKIIHNANQAEVFNSSQVYELVNEINKVFSSINISFVIKDNKVTNIYDNKFFNFQIKDEAELRKKWDETDGINIYFFNSITLQDLTLLNGYTSLPNLSKGSNAILLSYSNNSSEDFSLLKNKILIHELGHYFGLLHTYQDSNNPDLSKRELVTRGIGANCNTVGDQICDTSADPFEKIPSIVSMPCNDKIPDFILDLNGDSYTPPLDNYMSFHDKCGHSFTPFQYQKMEAGLNIRLSPNAEYKIQNLNKNFISIKSLNKKVFCSGDTISLTFEKSGNFDNTNKFNIEISNSLGVSFRPIDILGTSNNIIKFKIDDSFPSGENYRVLLKASSPEIESPFSENFEINNLPTAAIIANKIDINEGDELNLKISFGGSGPWGFTDWNNFTYEDIKSQNLIYTVKPEHSKLYSVSNVTNACGIFDISPSVFINVFKPELKILGDSLKTFCASLPVELEIDGLNPLNQNYYTIQIKDNSSIISLSPPIIDNRISFRMPQQIQTGKKYSIRIVGILPGEYSNNIDFLLFDVPAPPKISTPTELCFGSKEIVLAAVGKNIKWYYFEDDLIYTDRIPINTRINGRFNYYVTQTSENNCESAKRKVEIIVKDPVVAKISGSTFIKYGDSTNIKVNIEGNGPWKFEIQDLGVFQTSINENLIKVKPLQTTNYVLNYVNSDCGSGIVVGAALIEIGIPLSNPVFENSEYIVYPNPSSANSITITSHKSTIEKIQLINPMGLKVKKWSFHDQELERKIEIGNLPNGNYMLLIKTKNDLKRIKVAILK